MALGGTLLKLLALVVVVYVIYLVFFRKDTMVSGCQKGTKAKTLPASKLSGNTASNNYAYSIWFYISDWQYRLGESKDILVRGGASPRISLAPFENNLEININTYSANGAAGGEAKANNDLGTSPAQAPSCSINNVPLQRWVNALVSLNNRTLDVYLQGKLVRTCILPGVATVDPSAPVQITPGGGFKGWSSNIQFFDKPLNPQEAYNVYVQGPGCSGPGDAGFFDRHQIRLSYLVDNTEQASIKI